ncbi:MAG TPA: bifunctional methylenetetrahydrofolate dehydrogenase/methenyltetrahydrofolate cyclohydrolase FolD [Polyangiaceae bacterium]|nr:bifunctional methylenetetrahydrofolate dehydrogenase/methenyltetrahydrofolate cyclohydrolase FolD [Polyangiaceae bacterium]
MTARILDGKALAETVRAEVRERVHEFRSRYGRVPGLDVVLVGDDPASVIYTRGKEKASNEVGFRGRLHTFPATTAEHALVAHVAELNADPSVDGILVQLPLPKAIDPLRVLDRIDASKDVDGFHPINAGLLALGRPGALVPCTPAGCMRLVGLAGMELSGARAVVVGRSNTVGKPMAQLLLAANATVTIAHSRTRDLAAVCRTADVLVAAAGRANMVRGDWIKPGAVVIDVGTTRIAVADGKTKVVGDVAFDEAKQVAAFISPVPGGVGPMTIAMLLSNTLEAALRREAALRAGGGGA